MVKKSRRRRSVDTSMSLEMYYALVEESEKRMFDAFDELLEKFTMKKNRLRQRLHPSDLELLESGSVVKGAEA